MLEEVGVVFMLEWLFCLKYIYVFNILRINMIYIKNINFNFKNSIGIRVGYIIGIRGFSFKEER